MEEISQRTYMHIGKAHGHRQQCGGGGLVQGGKGGEMRGICNSVNNKYSPTTHTSF